MNEIEEIKSRAFARGFRIALEAFLAMLKDDDKFEEPECRGCDDYDECVGCKTHGGCGAERREE